jgi:hypothetical protein
MENAIIIHLQEKKAKALKRAKELERERQQSKEKSPD